MILWIWMLIRTFFWWTWDNEDISLQDDSNWFVEEITNTWDQTDINTPNKEEEKTSSSTQKNDNTIKVMMPQYFYNSWRNAFAEDLYNDRWTKITYVLIDDLNSYRDQLFESDFSQADIFLFPYDRSDKVSTDTFSPQQDMQSYFDKLIKPIVNKTEIWFLPFSADPMIMYTIPWQSRLNNFNALFDYTATREPISPLSFPIFFGLDILDKDKKWFTREYQDIVRYALMHYFTTNRDSRSLQYWIDSNSLESYNISDLTTISNAISSPSCKHFPSICFQIYNFVWIRFWFLSDSDIVNTYFPQKKENFEKLEKFSLPFAQLETPVRLWWRWIRKSLEDTTTNWVYGFIIQYMNNHDKYNLRNSTIPIFYTDEWNGILDNKYIWVRWYILQTWWDYINTLRNIWSFWNLLKYQITAKDYIR